MKIAYLTSLYARASDSFIRSEVQRLRAMGHTVDTFSIRQPPPAMLVGEDVKAEHARTKYLLRGTRLGLLFAAAWQSVWRPARVFAATRLALRTRNAGLKSLVKVVAYVIEAAALAHHLKRRRIEHLHNHIGENSATVAMLASLISGVPFSLTIHGPHEFDHPESLALDEKIARSTFTAAISEFGRSQLLRWCRAADWGKVQIVRCAADESFLLSRPTPVPDVPRLLCVGRLAPEKGQRVLVDAAAKLVAQGVPIEVVLIGDGPMGGELEQHIAAQKLENSVKLLGWKAADEVRDEMLRARAIVLPSFAEGLPVTIMEALALGRPVVSTRIAAIPELVQDGRSGWLVAPGSVDALAEAMRRVLCTPVDLLTNMGVTGAAAVTERHNPATEIVKLEQLIREGVAKPPFDVAQGRQAAARIDAKSDFESGGIATEAVEQQGGSLTMDTMLTEPGETCDGVVWFGNVDWWYHNRGHSSVRMATRLAKRVPTVFINSIGMRMPVPGKTEIAWTRYVRKLQSMCKGLRRDTATGMYVYSPVFVPRYSPRWIAFNGWLLAMQVRWVTRRLEMQRPSGCVSLPTVAGAVERIRWVKLVFERCDDFTTLPEADAKIVDGLERRLLERCDHAAYVSRELYERERGVTADAQLIGHGVDFEAFAQARPLVGPAADPPEAIRNLPRPIVGFFGGMDDYRMDAALMVEVARRIAPGTLVLVGPAQMDLSSVKAERNVVHVGQVAPELLPRYAGQFDVGVIPFLANDFNRNCNPIKLKEYLAAGFPIVATRLPAYAPYATLIELADTHDEFLRGLERALADRDASRSRARRQAVAGSSWDAVTFQMARMLAVESTVLPVRVAA